MVVSCPAPAKQPASWPGQGNRFACTAPISLTAKGSQGTDLREDEARGNTHPCEDCPQSCMNSPLR
eukprot:11308958-Heterocapsa_arctica.AAC.1